MGTTHDFVIIGAGAAGLTAAAGAAQLGLKVALIEREARLGGDCLHHGCVPSKTLIRSARVAHLMRRAADFGLPAPELAVDIAQVMERVRRVIDSIERHDSVERFRGLGVEVITGQARLLGGRQVEAGGRRLESRKILIATGSRAAVPPIPGLQEAGFITHVEVFRLQALPRRLVVIGAGAVGLELAQAFQRLGARVTVLEALGAVLGGREDAEVSGQLASILREEGVDLRLGVSITGAGRDANGRFLMAGDQRIDADEILVATGRAPNVEELGLEAAGVAYGPKGIQVDARLRTTARGIWACGDVTGPYLLTHVAGHQAGVVLANAIFHLPSKMDYRVLPWATYTDPELARVGLTEAEAIREHGEAAVRVFRQPFADVDRAEAEGETRGLLKLVCSRRGKILGVHILGPGAGDLLPEFVLAMRAGLGLKHVGRAIHAYPTLAEVNRKAASQFEAERLFSPLVRKVARFLARF